MPSRRMKPCPRQFLRDPSKEEYNRVIRLEGQINTVKEILRFLWRYDRSNDDDLKMVLTLARTIYFRMIDDLLDTFVRRGVVLVNEAGNLDDLIRLLKYNYFRHFPEEEREKPYHWPKIFWMQKLQELLEDKNNSLSDALVNGWHWFIDPEQYPSKSNGLVAKYSAVWTELDNNQKQLFLDSFSIDAAKLAAWTSGLESARPSPSVACEGFGLIEEFEALGVVLDVEHPEVTAPDTARRIEKCPACREDLKKEEIGSVLEHRPVQTPCGHVAGYSCFRKWFQSRSDCPICAADLSSSTYHYLASPKELLASCDRSLKWLHPPIDFTAPDKPHSHMDKLCLVFEPAEEIRKRMWHWMPSADFILLEWSRLQDLGMYVARERMAALVDKDVPRYRKAMLLQVQAGARRQWLEFLRNVLPS